MPADPLSSIGDVMKSKAKEIDILKEDVALFKNLINERKHPLDLLRELLSNAGAIQVGATRIEITYTVDKNGHIFEVVDDGCGMDFTGSKEAPGRLDKFLGLGLSAIVGREADEFSWKGLGSKLCFQSRRVEIETRQKGRALYQVVINEPWDTLNRNLIPRPRISEHGESGDFRGTKIKVYGHPPHMLGGKPFSFEYIRAFLLHRTFAGYTYERPHPPEVYLSVLGQSERLDFGFPEFRGREFPAGLHLNKVTKTLFVNLIPKSAKAIAVRLKGFLTWDADQYGLAPDNLNVGVLLSSKGIPYFDGLHEYGARGIVHANPGLHNTSLVVECDALHSQMNISRSGLVDSPDTLRFKETLTELFQTLEGSAEYLAFRQIPKEEKTRAKGGALATEKRAIEAEDQRWVVLERPGKPLMVLLREPQYEQEVNALLWKLEALDALPFHQFQTLAYAGGGSGPDLLVNFQEDPASEPLRAAVVEIENNFYNYKLHGHHAPQFPKVICWDIPTSGRKVKLNQTAKKYKFTANLEEHQVHIFVLKLMDGIKVVTRRELADKGIHV